jgi:hypothetical protein
LPNQVVWDGGDREDILEAVERFKEAYGNKKN